MTERSPRVSVIIPTHNRMDMLKETMQSILAQTIADLELLVVSNGSTDNTRELVSNWDDPRIRFFEQKNSGSPASPRNHGIRMARGQFIGFCDDDDLWLPTKLEKQLALMEKHPEFGFVFCGYAPLDQETSTVGPDVILDFLPGPDFARELQKNGNCVPSPTPLVRSQALRKVGGFDESPELFASEDQELWMRLAANYPVGYIPEALVHYRIHRTNTLAEQDLESILRRRIHVQIVARNHSPDIYSAGGDNAIRSDCEPLIRQLIYSGKRDAAKHWMTLIKNNFNANWLTKYQILIKLPSVLRNFAFAINRCISKVTR